MSTPAASRGAEMGRGGLEGAKDDIMSVDENRHGDLDSKKVSTPASTFYLDYLDSKSDKVIEESVDMNDASMISLGAVAVPTTNGDKQSASTNVKETQEEKPDHHQVQENKSPSRPPLRDIVGLPFRSPTTHAFGMRPSPASFASPSMRSRTSASPASMRKFTASIRASRQKRQNDRRMSLSSHSSHPPHPRVPPLTPGEQSMMDVSETASVEAMEALLLQMADPSNADKSPKRSSVTARKSSIDRLFEGIGEVDVMKQTTDTDGMNEGPGLPSNESMVSTLKSQPSEVSTEPVSSLEGANGKLLDSSSTAHTRTTEDSPAPSSPSAKESQYDSVTEKGLQLTPGSRPRPTPTKLSKSPKRVLNTSLLDSPARNTRSSSKKDISTVNDSLDETASIGELESLMIAMSQNSNVNENSPGRKGSMDNNTNTDSTRSGETTSHGSSLSPVDTNLEISVMGSKETTLETIDSPALSGNGKDAIESPLHGGTGEEDTASVGTEVDADLEIENVEGSKKMAVVDSPARNTRSAKKKSDIAVAEVPDKQVDEGEPSPGITNTDDTVSLGELQELFAASQGTVVDKKNDDMSPLSPRPSLGADETVDIGQFQNFISNIPSQSPSSGNEISHEASSVQEVGQPPRDGSSLGNEGSNDRQSDHASDSEQLVLTQFSHGSPHEPGRETRGGDEIERDETAGSDVVSTLSSYDTTKVDQSAKSKDAENDLSSPTASSPVATGSLGAADRSPSRRPTPTKLNASPKRVLNPNISDSPARNTRSAKRLSLASTLPIHGNEVEGSKRPFQELQQGDNEAPGGKRRKSMPMPKVAGILSLRKDRPPRGSMGTRLANRSVAFGSPKAAEYLIGSPSVSLTPMPREKAKELYHIPSGDAEKNEQRESLSPEHGQSEETVEIEADLDTLVDKMKGDAELSPIKNSNEIGDGEQMETSLVLDSSVVPEEKLETLDVNLELDEKESRNKGVEVSNNFSMDDDLRGEDRTGRMEVVDSALSPTGTGRSMEMEDSKDIHDIPGESTIELEPNVTALINQTLGMAHPAMSENRHESPNDSSMDMTDMKSIASVQSRIDAQREEESLIMEGQKLDFARGALPTKNVERVQEPTVELEIDMTSLLATALDANKKQTSGSDNSAVQASTADDSTLSIASTDMRLNVESPMDLETARSSRRSSIVSRRFSLAVPLDSSSLVENEDFSAMAKDSSHGTELVNQGIRSVEEVEEAVLNKTNNIHADVEEVKATLGEMIEASELFPVDQSSSFGAMASDSIVRFGLASHGLNNIFVNESLNKFLEAVCAEVESRTEKEIDEDTCVQELPVIHSRHHALSVQIALEKKDKSLKTIGKHVAGEIESEWVGWISSVLESLLSQVPSQEVGEQLKADNTILGEICSVCDETKDLIASLGKQKVERARRKSMVRRDLVATGLQDEIRELQLEIAEEKARYDGIKRSQLDLSARLRQQAECQTLSKDLQSLNIHLARSHEKFVVLKGIHALSPKGLREKAWDFEIGSLFREIWLSLNVSFSDGGRCSSSVKEVSKLAYRGHRRPHRLHASTSGYIGQILHAFVDRSAYQEHPCTNSLRLHTMLVEKAVGRMDSIALELEVLRRRYKARILKGLDAHERSSVVVVFSVHSVKLQASFELSTKYPWIPLEANFDLIHGDLNMERMQKRLVKDSRPGYGSLSRSCDIVLSFIEQEGKHSSSEGTNV